MLVQSLAAYADTYLHKQLEDQAFEEGRVPYWLELDANGRFLGIREKTIEEQVGKKTVQRAQTMTAPKSPVSRASGSFPLLACDALQYVLGPSAGAWTEPEEEDKHARHHAAFKELMRSTAQKTNDKALLACASFYDKPGEVEKARQALADKKPHPGAMVALAVAAPDQPAEIRDVPLPVVQREAVRSAWREHYAAKFAARHAAGGEGVCLISGRRGPIATTHDKVKGVGNLGGQAAGVSLMSFDKAAFRSYGWEQNANSPVSPERAAAYVLALNDLLKPGRHRQGISSEKTLRTRTDYGGMAFLYWTRQPADDDPFDAVNDPDTVADSFRAVLTGKERALSDLEANVFHLLAVSGNGGRLVVRAWHTASLAQVADSLRHWFAELRIANVFEPGKSSSPPGLYALLRAISPPRVEPADKVNAERSLQMVRRALFGTPVGRAVLAAALRRLRVGSGADRLSPARAGIVRVCVNDILRTEKKGERPMSESLDTGLDHPAYICGRMLAVFDKLQYEAHRDPEDPKKQVNVNVVDRYYGLASVHPALAFPKLEDLGHKHATKLRRRLPGKARAIESELHTLGDKLTKVGAKYPGQLSLEDQGRFAIGYHHQKADDARRIGEAKARKAAAGAAEEEHTETQ